MKAIDNIKKAWKSMSKTQKAKLIVTTVCDFGAAFMMEAAGAKLYSEEDSIVKRLFMKVAMLGTGMAISTAASKELNELIEIAIPEKKDKEDPENV